MAGRGSRDGVANKSVQDLPEGIRHGRFGLPIEDCLEMNFELVFPFLVIQKTELSSRNQGPHSSSFQALNWRARSVLTDFHLARRSNPPELSRASRRACWSSFVSRCSQAGSNFSDEQQRVPRRMAHMTLLQYAVDFVA